MRRKYSNLFKLLFLLSSTGILVLGHPLQARTETLIANGQRQNAQYHYSQCKAFLKESNIADAQKACLKAISLKPDHAKAHINLGVIYFRKAEMNLAEDEFNKALRYLDKDDDYNRALVYFNLASVYRILGRGDASWFFYRETYRLQPEIMEKHPLEWVVSSVTIGDKERFLRTVLKKDEDQHSGDDSDYLMKDQRYKVILKNGNVIEGKLLEENNRSITLSVFAGKGTQRIKREEVASIEKVFYQEKKDLDHPLSSSPPRSQTSWSQEQSQSPVSSSMGMQTQMFVSGKGFWEAWKNLPEEIRGKIKKIAAATAFIILVLFAAFVLLAKGRPFGVKAICFFCSMFVSVVLSLGLFLSSFVVNKIFYVFQGGFFYFILFWIVGFPLLILAGLFFMFHIKNWARFFILAVLIFWALNTTLSLIVRKDLVQSFFLKKFDQAKVSFMAAEPDQAEPEAEPPKTMPALIFIVLCSGGAAYLLLPRTAKFFKENKLGFFWPGIAVSFIVLIGGFFAADKIYQYKVIKLTNNSSIFKSPSRIEEDLGTLKEKVLGEQRRNYRLVKIHGSDVTLPITMKEIGTKSSIVISFVDKENGRIFTMTEMPQHEYRLLSVVEHARWNPVLLAIKFLTSMPLGDLQYVKAYRFEGGKMIVKQGQREKAVFYSFILGLEDKETYFSGLIMGSTGDDFIEEENVLKLLATIE